MKLTIKAVALLLAPLLLAGCNANTSVDGVVKSAERSSGPFGMIKSDDVKVDTGAAFKSVNDVIIGNFVVGFATYKTDSAKAGGGLLGSGMGGRSSAKTTLVGIDDATMQKITEEAYKGFVADLKAQGYNVKDRSALANSEKFKTSKSYENGYEDSAGGIFGSNSKTKYFVPKEFGVMRSFMDVQGFTGGFGFANPVHSVVEYATANNVKVLSVVYVLDFANSESYGSWSTSTSSVNVGQGMTVLPELTKVSIFGGQGGTFSTNNGSVRLGQPITSDKAFGEIKNTNSDGYKMAEKAINVVGILGGVGSNVSREYEVTAKPEAYRSAALDVLQQANQQLVGKMASLK